MNNSVYVGSKHDEFIVTDEAYRQIVEIVKAQKLCAATYNDRHAYTPENPCVGRGICLQHLLEKQPNLTWINVIHVTIDNKLKYLFADPKGVIYTSFEDTSDDARPSIDETLTYYGFLPPKNVSSRGKLVNFYSHYSQLYGELGKASVIVLSYNQYSEKVKGLFLLYKGGLVKEFSKKSDLFRRADELVEATKDAQGEYHINGRTHYGHYDADVYEVVSQLESAMYDVTLKLQNTIIQEEEDVEPLRKEDDPTDSL